MHRTEHFLSVISTCYMDIRLTIATIQNTWPIANIEKCDERREVGKNALVEGLRGTGSAAKTLSAKRGTTSFAVTVRMNKYLRAVVVEDLQIAN